MTVARAGADDSGPGEEERKSTDHKARSSKQARRDNELGQAD